MTSTKPTRFYFKKLKPILLGFRICKTKRSSKPNTVRYIPSYLNSYFAFHLFFNGWDLYQHCKHQSKEECFKEKANKGGRKCANTTKKGGYPSVFKSAGIAPKSAGIGSKFLSRRFFSRRFRPPLFECGDRVVRTCTSAFQKRGDRSQRFQTLFRRF